LNLKFVGNRANIMTTTTTTTMVMMIEEKNEKTTNSQQLVPCKGHAQSSEDW
jgi:hypothetical protein